MATNLCYNKYKSIYYTPTGEDLMPVRIFPRIASETHMGNYTRFL